MNNIKPTSIVHAELRELIANYFASPLRGEQADHSPIVRFVVELKPEERTLTACSAAVLLFLMDEVVSDLAERGKAPDEHELLSDETRKRAENANNYVAPLVILLSKELLSKGDLEHHHAAAMHVILTNLNNEDAVAVLSAILLTFAGLFNQLQGESK